jgi:hypothetical protein
MYQFSLTGETINFKVRRRRTVRPKFIPIFRQMFYFGVAALAVIFRFV